MRLVILFLVLLSSACVTKKSTQTNAPVQRDMDILDEADLEELPEAK